MGPYGVNPNANGDNVFVAPAAHPSCISASSKHYFDPGQKYVIHVSQGILGCQLPDGTTDYYPYFKVDPA